MSRRKLVTCSLGAALLALLGVGPASAQVFGDLMPVQAEAPKKTPMGPPAPGPKDGGPNIDIPKFEPIVSAALGDTSVAMSAPNMMGDFGATSVKKTILVPTTTVTTVTTFNPEAPPPFRTTTVTTTTGTTVPVTIFVPVAGRDGSGFKISDNESPIPTDRIFFTWNCFDDLRSRGGSNAGSSSSQFTGFDGFGTATQSVTLPVVANPQGDLNREIFGFEKTFLGGDASIEIRVPIFEGSGDFGSGFNGNHFGDVTAVTKLALFRDPDGLTFSIGLAATFPVGQPIAIDQGNLHPFLFQPFFGYLYRFGDVYVQGFTSVVVSTASDDPSLLFNDLGVGYRFYKGARGDYLRGIDSVLEVHVTTPLEGRGQDADLIVTDIVSFTGGFQLGIGERAILSLGLNSSVTGPRPYGIEALVQLDYRF